MNEQSVFIAALECVPADRARFLEQACGNDPGLRRRVERLIASHEAAVSFMDEPAGQLAATIGQPPLETSGSQIGPYRLLRQIGEGGMGAVYMAEQVEPVRRKVALKIIKPGMDTRQVIARFEAERQALSLMDHPNIAKVLDAGTTSSGRPYFVMELVKGQPITDYCDERQLTPRERLELLLPVCQAIQHAHQKGIIHRDIKPSNILVAEYDEKAVPKVIDFGVAKAISQPLTEKTMFTGVGQIVGTLEYMSPEQAKVNQLDIDTRSDIYSLGVLMYELLTGSTPIDKQRLRLAAWDEMLRMIREEEPPKPSTRLSESKDSLPSISAQRHTEPAKLTRLLRGELDWIVMKALEKDRGRRYETANGFGADIQRFLAGEAVLAVPPSAAYRLQKFAKRNKRGLATATLLGWMLLVTGVALVWQARQRLVRQAEVERKTAVAEEAVGQALDRAEESRRALQAVLEKPGGAHGLLNQPGRWEVFIRAVQTELKRAEAFADGVDGGLSQPLKSRLEELTRQVAGDETDYRLAVTLDSLRSSISPGSDGQLGLDRKRAARECPRAFASAGFALEPGKEAELAKRIARSPIREQLLAGLDDWAASAEEVKQAELAKRLLLVARLADPDPWRDRFRDPATRADPNLIGSLVEAARQDAGVMERLTPQMLFTVGLKLEPQVERSIAWFRRAQSLHPSDFWINYTMGFLLFKPEPEGAQRGETRLVQFNKLAKPEAAMALGYLRAAVALRPDVSLAHCALGTALLDMDDLPGAIASYRKALSIDERNETAWHNLALALAEVKDFAAAIDACKKSLAIDDQNVSAWNSLGNILSDANDLAGAMDAFKRALAIDERSANAWHNLGLTLREGNDLPGAIDAFRKAVAIDDKFVRSWIGLGQALRESNDTPGFLGAFQKAIAVNERDPTVWYNFGRALVDNRDNSGAIKALKKATELKADYTRAWSLLGWVYRDENDLPRSADAFRKAVALDGKDLANIMNLGIVLLNSNDAEGASNAFESALALNDKDADIWSFLAAARKAKGDAPGAVDAARQAVTLNEQDPDLWYNLGVLLGLVKDEAGAIAAFQNGLAINKNDAKIFNALAWPLATSSDLTLRDPDRALALAKKAVEIDPDNPSYVNTLGVTLYRALDYQAAIAALERSMELKKGGSGIDWLFLAMAHWQLDDKEKARERYDRAVTWMDTNQPKNEELRRFRTEAAELLGLEAAN